MPRNSSRYCGIAAVVASFFGLGRSWPDPAEHASWPDRSVTGQQFPTDTFCSSTGGN